MGSQAQVFFNAGRYVYPQAATQTPTRCGFFQPAVHHSSQQRAGHATHFRQVLRHERWNARLKNLQQRELSRVRDTRRNSWLSAGSSQSRVTTEAEANDADSPTIYSRLPLQPVHHGADDGLPVGAQFQAVFNKRGALTRPVKHQAMIAAPQCGDRIPEVTLFGCTVVAPIQDERRSGNVATGGTQEIASQAGLLIRNPDLFHRGVHQRSRLSEALSMQVVGASQFTVQRLSEEED